jgi:hypothetical protein
MGHKSNAAMRLNLMTPGYWYHFIYLSMFKFSDEYVLESTIMTDL